MERHYTAFLLGGVPGSFSAQLTLVRRLVCSRTGAWFAYSMLTGFTMVRKPLPQVRTFDFQVNLQSCYLYCTLDSCLDQLVPVPSGQMCSAASQVLACLTAEAIVPVFVESLELHLSQRLLQKFTNFLVSQLWLSTFGINPSMYLIFMGYLLGSDIHTSFPP